MLENFKHVIVGLEPSRNKSMRPQQISFQNLGLRVQRLRKDLAMYWQIINLERMFLVKHGLKRRVQPYQGVGKQFEFVSRGGKYRLLNQMLRLTNTLSKMR
jgi:hypothetical protein